MSEKLPGYGTLYLVATPIGNLEDITQRAVRILGEVSLIAAEDTRQTQKLLNHLGIKAPLVSYHEHNARRVGEELVEKLRAGKSIALVSDAGMPAVSDPGEDIVRLAAQEAIPVTVIPGASASLSALVLSGLSTQRFAFEGFLPVKGRERKERLASIAKEARTLILYEAPHRVVKTLEDLAAVCGSDRPAAAARELTKLYEEIRRGTLAELAAHFTVTEPRGEFVLVIAGYIPEQVELNQDDAMALVSELMQSGMARKEAIKEAARRAGMDKRELYKLMIDNGPAAHSPQPTDERSVK
ncbi:MAG: 16S rRNA (cytidine(1402)-2'-O)-methyltransferase [Bacillota bacterium]